MKRFFTYLKTELKLSVRDMNMVIFAVIMPLVIFIILGIIYGTKPAYDGADYTFLEQSFGAVSAIAICASGLMGLPLAVSGLREMKILKRLRVTPVSPVFVLGVELSMYIVYCAVSLATLSVVALLWGVRLRGCDLTSIIIEAFNQIGKWLESSKISGSRLPARENQHVRVGKICLTEGGIGQHGDTMGCSDLFGVFNRNGCNSDSCSSHKINYS